ncbi:DUF58 domain-containing protein [bacterium]|nr:DUF58 domain-containing protein [bacterium]
MLNRYKRLLRFNAKRIETFNYRSDIVIVLCFILLAAAVSFKQSYLLLLLIPLLLFISGLKLFRTEALDLGISRDQEDHRLSSKESLCAELKLKNDRSDTHELQGVKEYQSGNSLQNDNGNTSACHPESLSIKNFKREKTDTVILVLDTQGQTLSNSTEDNLLKHTLKATKILSEALLNSGNRVGLFVFGNYNNWIFPGNGNAQRERLLRALTLKTGSRSSCDSNLIDLPDNFLTSESLLIMVSPMLGNDPWMLQALKGRQHQVVVVCPDEVDFESRKGRESRASDLALRYARMERQMMTRELNDNSIPVLDWQVDMPFDLSIKEFLGIHWQ